MDKGFRSRRRSHYSNNRGGRGGRHSQFNFYHDSNHSNSSSSNQGSWRSPSKSTEQAEPSPPPPPPPSSSASSSTSLSSSSASHSFNATDLIPFHQESSSASFNVREASHALKKLFSYVQQQEHEVYPTFFTPKRVGYLGKNSSSIYFLTQLKTLCNEASS